MHPHVLIYIFTYYSSGMTIYCRESFTGLENIMEWLHYDSKSVFGHYGLPKCYKFSESIYLIRKVQGNTAISDLIYLPMALDFGVHHLSVTVLELSPSLEGMTRPSKRPVKNIQINI